MKITRESVEFEINLLSKAVEYHKLELKKNEKRPADSKLGLIDKSVFILGDLQLLSPTLDIDRQDPLFKKIAKIQQEIRMMER